MLSSTMLGELAGQESPFIASVKSWGFQVLIYKVRYRYNFFYYCALTMKFNCPFTILFQLAKDINIPDGITSKLEIFITHEPLKYFQSFLLGYPRFQSPFMICAQLSFFINTSSFKAQLHICNFSCLLWDISVD